MSDPVELAVLAANVRHLAEAVEKAEQSHKAREDKLDKITGIVTDLQTRLTVLETKLSVAERSTAKDIERLENRIRHGEDTAKEIGESVKKLEMGVWKITGWVAGAGAAGGVVAKVIGLLGG